MIKKIKNWWKRRKYWEKGGVIGSCFFILSILAFLVMILIDGLRLFLVEKLMYGIIALPHHLARLLLDKIAPTDPHYIGPASVIGLLITFITMLLIYPLIGIVIGFIIDLIKKKRNKKPKKK